MKTPKFTKSIFAGAVVLGLSATGVTVWANTNSPFRTLSNISVSAKATTHTGTKTNDTQITSDYAAYVNAAYKIIAADVQSGDKTTAESIVSSVRSNLTTANQWIQQGHMNKADTLLIKAKSKLDSSSVAINDSSNVSTTSSSSLHVSGGTNLVSGNVLGKDTLALSTALQHAGNLQAQSKIEQNILKAFVHLDAKLKQMNRGSDTTNKTTVTAKQTVAEDNSDTANGSKAHSNDRNSVHSRDSVGLGLGVHLKVGSNAHVKADGHADINSHS